LVKDYVKDFEREGEFKNILSDLKVFLLEGSCYAGNLIIIDYTNTITLSQLKKENAELTTELETTKTQKIADQTERDTLQVQLKAKQEEIENLKVEYERAQKQVQEMQETNSEAKKVNKLLLILFVCVDINNRMT